MGGWGKCRGSQKSLEREAYNQSILNFKKKLFLTKKKPKLKTMTIMFK